MALTSVGRLSLGDPNLFFAALAVDNNSAWQISSSGAKFGFIFQVPRTGTINRLGVRIASASSPVLSRIGLYTVDTTTGNPTTTAYGGSTYGTFTPAPNSFFEVTLGTNANANAGDLVALVCEFNSTTGNYYFTGWAGGNTTNFPYASRYSNSNRTWNKVSRAYPGAFSVGYTDGSHPELGSYPLSATVASASYNSTSSSKEYGLQIACPFTASCVGLWHMFTQAANADLGFRLYNGTTMLAEQVMPGNVNSGVSPALGRVFFPAPVVLTPGNTYYLSALARTTANTTARWATVSTAPLTEQLGYAPALAPALATRSGGAWATSTTQIPALGPIFEQIDNGSGSSSTTLLGAPFSRIFTEL